MDRLSGDKPGKVTLDVAGWQEEGAMHLFKPWPPALADAAGIRPQDRVLDVGCGTGVLARYLTEYRQADVTGIDQNEAMLSLASALAPQIRWDHGRAELLPYKNNSFDAVVSQFALTLFHNAEDAVKEMIRVVRPGRSIAVAVWDTLESSSAFQALRNVLSGEFGSRLAGRLSFDRERLSALFLHPGIHSPELRTLKSMATFPSVSSWIRAGMRWWGWTDPVSSEDLSAWLPVAEKALAGYADPQGKVTFEVSAHIITTVKEQLD
ncbi:MAG TPA: class I SAM-dependent methyltransferase [Sphingobacteriaceae bacterium]